MEGSTSPAPREEITDEGVGGDERQPHAQFSGGTAASAPGTRASGASRRAKGGIYE